MVYNIYLLLAVDLGIESDRGLDGAIFRLLAAQHVMPSSAQLDKQIAAGQPEYSCALERWTPDPTEQNPTAATSRPHTQIVQPTIPAASS
jgi:hypothetical protein